MTHGRIPVILSALFLMLLLNSCGPTRHEIARAEYGKTVRSIRTIGLLPPDIFIYEVEAGGLRELMDEWIAKAGQKFSSVLRSGFQSRSVALREIRPDKEINGDLEDVAYLFRAISQSLQWRTTYARLSDCGSTSDPCRDLSVGGLDPVLKKNDVDAFLLLFAENEIETPGRRKARKASRAIGMFTGFRPVSNPGTFISMAIVDRSGTVLWYTGAASGRGYDLRNDEKVEELAMRLLNRFYQGEADAGK